LLKCQITEPRDNFAVLRSVSDLLQAIKKWRSRVKVAERGSQSHVWFRGQPKCSYRLAPGIFRDEFEEVVFHLYGKNIKRDVKAGADGGLGPVVTVSETSLVKLCLSEERKMLREFCTSGATLLDTRDDISVYFAAQHYGMPTRLLDWSTNPLIALFFAISKNGSEDGKLYVMQPTRLPPPLAQSGDPEQNILSVRDSAVRNAIRTSFEKDCPELESPLILHIRPDSQAGRIRQQSSCFTLHSHLVGPRHNPTLEWFRIPAKCKKRLREELCRLDVNEFSIFNDLDHLSNEIRRKWGLLAR
jgi:hypothetical protein